MNYTIVLTEQEINIIGAGLGKLPFEQSAPLIQNIAQQVNNAMEAAKSKEKVDKKKVANA